MFNSKFTFFIAKTKEHQKNIKEFFFITICFADKNGRRPNIFKEGMLVLMWTGGWNKSF